CVLYRPSMNDVVAKAVTAHAPGSASGLPPAPGVGFAPAPADGLSVACIYLLLGVPVRRGSDLELRLARASRALVRRLARLKSTASCLLPRLNSVGRGHQQAAVRDVQDTGHLKRASSLKRTI